ncbi:DUF29 domain-containing protein [Synechocystis salina]|uniref:DUF29 domain-containing protein n=1 Tax=Synechocystis salina LEGE 00031 TaxID=1828736 RepID=A0ABR9VPB8_9SYNC|nr:DUF29 domain-containing protein [Synechocystis salina]MBE9239916.1 DUF29 domain-containing protein [Synechocystis salina LEGE 00041]MBE9253201.1 DUF29 domain-containing protein [Synechocystis salina LEGE 00031]
MSSTVLKPTTLYEVDYLLWTEEIISKLKARDFEYLDVENLIEEIEDLGRSQKRELRQRLATLLEHLLKRIYVGMPQEYNGWERTIREQRRQIRFEIKASPSLKSIWEQSFDLAWEFALETVRDDYAEFNFPDLWPWESDIDTVLTVNFWEIE